jgi:Protein of unknown function (DUF2934)
MRADSKVSRLAILGLSGLECVILTGMFWIFSIAKLALDSPDRHVAKSSNLNGTSIDVPPTADEIRQRAYEIFVARGGEPGHESDDWEQAERELQARTLLNGRVD